MLYYTFNGCDIGLLNYEKWKLGFNQSMWNPINDLKSTNLKSSKQIGMLQSQSQQLFYCGGNKNENANNIQSSTVAYK